MTGLRKQKTTRFGANPLGDIRAEADREMLEKAFYETPDYHTIAESRDRCIIIGRRGTGKSALALRLSHHWEADSKHIVVRLIPREDQVIGLRPLIQMFGEKYNHVRAGSRIAWTYAILAELALKLLTHWKSKSFAVEHAEVLRAHAQQWQTGDDVTHRLRTMLRRCIDPSTSAEERIAELADRTKLNELREAIKQLLGSQGLSAYVIVDKLDEGFEPDDLGVALIAGIANASTSIDASIKQIRTVCFLRDNIFRAIAERDPDFSRNLEGQYLRLHWGEYELLEFICRRMRSAFGITADQSIRVWNALTADNLQKKDGFRECLRLTLYRPRDLLVLLNNAFYASMKEGGSKISREHINSTAKTISIHRLDDLKKEYDVICPGLSTLVDAFVDGAAEMTLSQAREVVEHVTSPDSHPAPVAQQFRLLPTSDLLRTLYSVGFLGVFVQHVGRFVFCHDGSQSDDRLTDTTRVMIHPCYRIALNLRSEDSDGTMSVDIHDEYKIHIESETPAIRNQALVRYIDHLREIPEGADGSAVFEKWCCDVVGIVFAGKLYNPELHPNRNASQRRDVVARNGAESGAWRRIHDDYDVRQVVWEVKNYRELGPQEYRQMRSYLSLHYGRLGFIITRGSQEAPLREKDLAWIREQYNTGRVVIIPVPATFLTRLLTKLRNPQKHDEPDKAMNKLLDDYERLYLSDAKLGGTRKRSKGGTSKPSTLPPANRDST